MRLFYQMLGAMVFLMALGGWVFLALYTIQESVRLLRGG